MKEITWKDFEQVELRIGTIVDVKDFPEARKPAYKLKINFGKDIGEKRSSAQIIEHYSKEQLVGKQILAVVNFPPKQIGPFMSECLVTGLSGTDGKVILISPDKWVEDGSKLF
ncbi:MAG: tRNA-binding protein [Balneola sp.]